MSPIVSTVVSALERAAQLIEKGMPAAKALRQTALDLEAYADGHQTRPIPEKAFELGKAA